METLLSKDRKINFGRENASAKLTLWGQLGSVLLLGAFTVLIFKCAPDFWPLFLTAFMGYIALCLWKKKGFYFSLLGLSVALIFTIQAGIAPFWPALLSPSIGLSWFLILLGRLEIESLTAQKEDMIRNLAEKCHHLEKQLFDVKVLFSEENKANIFKIERLNHHYAQASNNLNEMKHSLELSERERQELDRKCEMHSKDIIFYQRNEIALHRAFDDAQTELLKLKNQQESKPVTANIIAYEEIDSQEKVQLEQVQRQLALLREQFEEKSEALDLARKELFRLDNELSALKKTQEEKSFEIPEENLFLKKDLLALEEERRDLEIQVTNLQDFISALLNSKKRTPRSRKSLNKIENQERLPLILQENIDQTVPSETD